MTLTLPPEQLKSLQASDSGAYQPIWSVFIKDDDIQVERPYTPLYGIDNEGRMSFWVKKYPKGEVGRWLHGKTEGDRIEIRGPITTWPWQDGMWDEVVMISGGTGITPFVQLWSTIISSPDHSPNTRFTLLHSSPSSDELPPAEVLSPLLAYAAERPERLKVQFFVDQDAKALPSLPPSATPAVGRINRAALEKVLYPNGTGSSWWRRLFSTSTTSQEQQNSQRRVLFLVCGPEPMIGALAGPYGRNFSQGPVGGVLKELGYDSTQVYKL
ncbi:hypothetical protein BD626DRAFT_545452 [Schizophyllum amplum]|uniref:FAD-binding FR-type domain-containing protein n=1 Tax=Schizophyllum amplum TaxID=97359 RepID=A0A550CU58_9AGAR|nr:hypothetical protein BD626DRAFT_545452 [Auriculariopsis ampla]